MSMPDSIRTFVETFPNMNEEEAVAYLTEHFADFPEPLQELIGSMVLSRALDTQIEKYELKAALNEILEAAADARAEGGQ